MKRSKPTQADIDKAIKLLQDLKEKMPKRNTFGENNHELIDLEIQVLEGKLNEDNIYDHGDMIASQLLDCIEWRRGDSKDWMESRFEDLENFS
jgi:hypothetical protein